VKTDSPASKTAAMVAGYRARASERENPICSDPWADLLVGEFGRELSAQHDAAMPFGELWIGVRTAWLDARVRQLSGSERPQVVILGAGYDTRAARLAADGVRFFEVDHPESQAHKLERLGTLDGYPADAATYVGCDFEKDDWFVRLQEEGWDPAVATVFLWEGVTMYLTTEAIEATLSRIARCHPSTVLFFDFFGKKMAQGRRLDAGSEQLRELVADVGEPFLNGWNDVVPLLSGCGFRHVRVINFDQAALSLTGTYDRDRMFRFQSFAATSVGFDFGL